MNEFFSVTILFNILSFVHCVVPERTALDLTYISTKLCIFSSSRTTQIRLCVSNLTLLGIVYSPEHNRTS